MANSIKGLVSFDFEGRTYTLAFDFNSMVEYEDATGENAMNALQAFDRGELSAKQARALFWAMLTEHHPEVDIRQAGKMVMTASEKLGEALSKAAMKQEETAPGNVKSRVRKPKR